MATKAPSYAQIKDDTWLVTWGPLANGDDGGFVSLGHLHIKTFQVFGTFGAGGTILLEGTLQQDGTQLQTLKDDAAALISLTAAGIKVVKENVTAARPRVSAGDGATSLTALMLAHRPS